MINNLNFIKHTFLTVAFFYAINCNATFLLTGTTITQTGTDTVTSATAIPGTTTSTINGQVTVFDFGGNSLEIDGTINILDGVAFHNVRILNGSTGILNAGVEESNPSDYKYNYGVDMISVPFTDTISGALTMNIYGQSAYFNSNGFGFSSSTMEWKYARMHIDGRMDLTGAGYVVENTHLIITGVFPNAHFFRAASVSWVGNIIDAEDTNSYFALSTATPAGTYNFNNITLLTGQNLVAYGSTATDRILNIINISSGTNYTLDATTTTGIRHFTLQLNHSFNNLVQDGSFNPIEGARVFLDGGNGTTQINNTNLSGEVYQIFRYQNNVVDNGLPSITSFISGNTISKRIISYNHLISPEEVIDIRSSQGNETTTTMADDLSITESDKLVVDAYTEIDTAAKFYDIAKAHLVDNYAGESATIVTRSGDEINTGSYDVIIDATATSAFAFDGTTITIKATEFIGSIRTTGTVTQSNGATIFGGYVDSTGINKFVYLDWNSSTTLDVEIENLDTNTSLITTSATEIYKGHFLFPSPAPLAGVRINIISSTGFPVYQQIIPENILTFIDRNVTLGATESSQLEMIFLAKKLLQKTEAINNTINGVTPPFSGTLTTTALGGNATVENQEALLVLLRYILLKTTASRNSFD